MQEVKREIDIRGMVCPMTWVKTKMELQKLNSGDCLKVLIDDGPPIENLPRSVKEDGHKIVKLKCLGEYYEVIIKKDGAAQT